MLEPRLVDAFLEYAQARDIHVDPTRVRHPKDKARVEQAVPGVRDDCFAGEDLTKIDGARALARHRCLEDYGQRRHSQTQRRPLKRLSLARQQQLAYQDFLLVVFGDEASRRDALTVTTRVLRAHLDPAMHLDAWDPTATVTLDRTFLNDLASLRFTEAHAHVAIVGPVGVGKTFLAHALGHAACRRGHSVLALRADRLLKDPQARAARQHL